MPKVVSKLFIKGVSSGLSTLLMTGLIKFVTALMAVVAVVSTVLKMLLVEGL